MKLTEIKIQSEFCKQEFQRLNANGNNPQVSELKDLNEKVKALVKEISLVEDNNSTESIETIEREVVSIKDSLTVLESKIFQKIVGDKDTTISLTKTAPFNLEPNFLSTPLLEKMDRTESVSDAQIIKAITLAEGQFNSKLDSLQKKQRSLKLKHDIFGTTGVGVAIAGVIGIFVTIFVFPPAIPVGFVAICLGWVLAAHADNLEKERKQLDDPISTLNEGKKALKDPDFVAYAKERRITDPEALGSESFIGQFLEYKKRQKSAGK